MQLPKIGFSGEIFLSQRFGGISRYFIELATHLKSQNLADIQIDAWYYTNQYLHDHRNELAFTGRFCDKGPRGAYRVRKVLNQLHHSFDFRKHDLLHATYYDHESFARKLCRRVTTFYDMIHERCDADPRFLRRKQLAYQKSDRCIAISEATKADVVAYLNADPAKVDVVYLATDFPTRDLGQRQQKNYVLWVGGRAWYKNFSTFVAAYAKSRACLGGVQLVLAGGPRPSPQELQEWASAGIDVELVQHCSPNDDELTALYRDALALFYISKLEGFGIPPLEAMACMCPVVASNVSSIPEVVGDAALQVDPDDIDSIADAIDNVCQQESLRDELRTRGAQRVRQFSWKKCAQETMRVYDKAMQ
jgi:glycosyltransferase involved in cell wall biosynthesis